MKNIVRRSHAGALLASMVMMSALFAIQGSLLTNIIDHFRLSDSAQGLASSATFVGGVVALVASFLLMGRLPKLLLLRLAMALSFFSLVLLYFAPSYDFFVIVWFVIGIGLGFMDTLLSACIADIYTGKDATRMMCILHMCFGISSMISPLIFTALMNGGIPWNQVYFYVSGTGAVLLIFACFIFSRSGLGRESASASRKLSVKNMFTLLKTGPIPLLVAAMFFHGMFLSGMSTWINRYIGVTLSSDMGTMGMSFMFFGVMISRLLLPMLPITTRTFVRYGCILAGLIVLAGVLIGNGTVMCIAVCLGGLAFGAMIPCLLSIACAATPENTFFATTALMLSYYIGQSIISPIIGALETTISLHVGIALCALCMIASSLMCLFNKHISKDI